MPSAVAVSAARICRHIATSRTACHPAPAEARSVGPGVNIGAQRRTENIALAVRNWRVFAGWKTYETASGKAAQYFEVNSNMKSRISKNKKSQVHYWNDCNLE